MLRSLPSAEFECHLVVPADPPLRAELEAAGVGIHIVPMARISTSHGVAEWARYAIGWPIAVARISRLIRRLDIDVVHTNSLHSWYAWAAAALTRRPHVWHGREIVVQSRAALRVERFLTRHFATLVICMSQAIADQLDADPAKVVVVYETADPAEFSPARAGRFRAEHRHSRRRAARRCRRAHRLLEGLRRPARRLRACGRGRVPTSNSSWPVAP